MASDITPVPFDKARHMREVLHWSHSWGVPVDPAFLPPTGFIVPGVAAMFIFLTNAPVAFVDHVISNPESDPKERDRALDLIGICIMAFARDQGVKGLVGYTKLPKMAERCERHGWKLHGAQTIMTRKL